MSGAALPARSSPAALAADNPVRRLPKSPNRPRPAEFASTFDSGTLVYDCFWHTDGKRILLVGPPPLNLSDAFRRARYTAKPGGEALTPRFYTSLSTMITSLDGAPPDTAIVEIVIAGEIFRLPVQPNSAHDLAGRKLLFTMNRDNDLAWIREWATFHARVHGTEAVVLVDNASSKYEAAEVQATLAAVPGITHAAVPTWPQGFGALDSTARINHHWSRFLHICSMSMVLRRYGELAYGLLNLDIDELAGTRSGAPIYDLAKQSRGGLAVFRGTWIEATGAGTRHRDFTQKLADARAARCRQRKWVLDPSRAWVRKLSVHPYWHWIAGRALLAKSMPADALYWHFRGISTNWKQHRTKPPIGALEADTLLVTRFALMSD